MAELFRELSDVEISVLVRSFYVKVQKDEVLAQSFASRISDWEPHLRKMEDFWSSVANGSGRYKGMPMPIHMKMDELQEQHFLQWLALFRETAREVLPADAAEHVIIRAERIAASIRMGLDYVRSQERSLAAKTVQATQTAP
ncbi:MAG: group III truncated hemoglobin [Hyphomicrobiales bacterium]